MGSEQYGERARGHGTRSIHVIAQRYVLVEVAEDSNGPQGSPDSTGSQSSGATAGDPAIFFNYTGGRTASWRQERGEGSSVETAPGPPLFCFLLFRNF